MIHRLLFLAAACLMAQGCLLSEQDRSTPEDAGVNGQWRLERVIDVFVGEEVSSRDTSPAPTGSFEHEFLVISGSQFRTVRYDFTAGRPDTSSATAQFTGGTIWVLDGDTASIVREGDVLRVGMARGGGDSLVREFSRHAGAFPPASWLVPDTGSAMQIWRLLFETSEWWSGEDSGIDTFDYTEDEDHFLVIRDDSLFVARRGGTTLVSGERTGANTWALAVDDVLTIVSRSQMRMEFVVAGYDEALNEAFQSRVRTERYTGVFPPPEWNDPLPEDPNEPDNTPAQATPLVVGAAATSARLRFDDVDWYSFSAQAGTTYTIRTFGTLDTYLRLYAANGTTLLEENDDFGFEDLNAGLVWTASTTGTLYFTVRGYGDAESGAYTVQVVTGSPFFKAGAAAGRARKGSGRGVR